MEAISFGIPILAYNVYALNEIVNEINGVLLPVESDSNEIAICLEKIMKSSFSSERIKQNWKENAFAGRE